MGKWIKIFDKHEDYEAFVESQDYIEPHLSFCKDNQCIQYDKQPCVFTITALPANNPNVMMTIQHDGWTEYFNGYLRNNRFTYNGENYYKLFYYDDFDDEMHWYGLAIKEYEDGSYVDTKLYFFYSEEEMETIEDVSSITIDRNVNEFAGQVLLNVKPSIRMTIEEDDTEYYQELYEWTRYNKIIDGVTYYGYSESIDCYNLIEGDGMEYAGVYFTDITEGTYTDFVVYFPQYDDESGETILTPLNAHGNCVIEGYDKATENVKMNYVAGNNVKYKVNFPVYNIIPIKNLSAFVE